MLSVHQTVALTTFWDTVNQTHCNYNLRICNIYHVTQGPCGWFIPTNMCQTASLEKVIALQSWVALTRYFICFLVCLSDRLLSAHHRQTQGYRCKPRHCTSVVVGRGGSSITHEIMLLMLNYLPACYSLALDPLRWQTQGCWPALFPDCKRIWFPPLLMLPCHLVPSAHWTISTFASNLSTLL